MSHQVIARKYRPGQFSEVVGQQGVIRTLKRAVEQDRVAHAYLFSGVRGVGKTTLARLLAKCLNCETGPTPEPCGTCDACVEIARSGSQDVVEIDGASHNSVEHVRSLCESLQYRPVRDSHKVVILDEVHMLSTAAFNALLKTLEEPPESVVFIFATTEPHRLPATILSRVQHFQFGRISLPEIQERLAAVAADEGLDITEGALRAIARAADGSMRDGQSHLEKVVAFAGDKVDEKEVDFILGTVSRAAVAKLVDGLAQSNVSDLMNALEKHVVKGDDLEKVAQAIAARLRALTLISLVKSPADLLQVTDEEVEDLRTQGAQVAAEQWVRLLDLFVRGLPAMKSAVDSRMHLELLCIKGALLPRILPLDVVLSGAPIPAASSGGSTSGASSSSSKSSSASSASSQPAQSTEPDTASPAPQEKHLAITSITPFQVMEEEPVQTSAKDPVAWVKGEVRKMKGQLPSIFEQVKKIKVDTANAILEVILPDTFPIFLHMIQDDDNRKPLEEMGNRLIGKPFVLKAHLETADADDLGQLARLETEDPELKRKEAALHDPSVQKVLKTFKGEIMDIEELH